MEQQGLFGGGEARAQRVSPVMRFAFPNGESVDLDARSGQVLSTAPVHVTNVDAAQAIRKDYADSWKGFSYVIRSALHKEVRRGDVVRALRWSRLLSLANGEPKVRAYAKQIIFEETRNLALHFLWKGARGFDADLMIRQITASIKKWEMEKRRNCFADYVLAYRRALGQPAPSPADMDAALETRMLHVMYEMFWRVQLTQNTVVLAMFDDKIRETLSEFNGDEYQDFATNWVAHLYTTKTGIELIAGAWAPDGSTFIRDVSADYARPEGVIDVPELFDYVYDNHTRPGLVRYVRDLPKVKPGKPQPPGMDLRWSGMVRGVCWREHAFAQYGLGYDKVTWESVDIPAEIWEATVWCDGYFYGSLYKRAGIRGVPLPRL